MTLFFALLVPGILAAVAITGTVKKVDVYQGLADGAMDGMKILLRILPALVGLLTAVHMLRASGLRCGHYGHGEKSGCVSGVGRWRDGWDEDPPAHPARPGGTADRGAYAPGVRSPLWPLRAR